MAVTMSVGPTKRTVDAAGSDDADGDDSAMRMRRAGSRRRTTGPRGHVSSSLN